ncbi:unnamed protein product, partial [Brassica oleracea var. botrytis]
RKSSPLFATTPNRTPLFHFRLRQLLLCQSRLPFRHLHPNRRRLCKTRGTLNPISPLSPPLNRRDETIARFQPRVISRDGDHT